MVNGDGAQQSTVIERLIRLEVEVSALNQRMTDNNNLLNERMTDNNNLLLEAIRQTNQRITETNNLLLEAIRQTNERLDATNNLLLEAIRQTNQRIDATNQATNTRLDNQIGELRREFRSEFNKLTYLILGTGAAIIAAVAAAQLFT